MSATSLAAALRAVGLACHVEPREKLALISTVESPDSLANDEFRQRVLSLAREHGFTHVAVELAPTDRGATLRRD